jgi:hypothetical protein
MLRLILGAVVGTIVAFIGVFSIEWIGRQIHPLPGEMPTDLETMKQVTASLPAEALAWVVAGWTVGALAGALAGNAIAKRALAGWIAVALLLVATIANLVMLPHPLWMTISGILLPLLMGWLAQRIQKLPL